MVKILRRRLFGDEVLRAPTRKLQDDEILSSHIQDLINNMQHTLVAKKYGVGLAAPQIGESVAVSLIWIKVTPSRPAAEEIKLVMINPEIIKTYGRRAQLWEGCISFGTVKDFPYAKALRWKKVRVRYKDEHAKTHEKDVEGLLAQVVQHEVDHLNGILFVDRVRDARTYTMVSEYIKQVRRNQRPENNK